MFDSKESMNKGEMTNRLEGSCCLVTGGAGFIGSTIVDQCLLDAGVAEVRVLDNFVRGNWSNVESAIKRGAKVTDGDIRDAGLVDHLCNGADFVFHQAALRLRAVLRCRVKLSKC